MGVINTTVEITYRCDGCGVTEVFADRSQTDWVTVSCEMIVARQPHMNTIDVSGRQQSGAVLCVDCAAPIRNHLHGLQKTPRGGEVAG